ncbi:hypothetical protein AB0O34_13960 [Sphaerisporangium sp. NPDC088356]|uniref:hypothetical protein n=1 Tax=Sphaerisporangium sp. NPDC088356 TaxID=3154871 RepID=UPI003449CC03
MDATPEDAAYITPEAAARSLREIRASQAGIVRARPWFPTWYPVGVGVYVTGLQFFTEPGTSGLLAVTGTTLLAVALAGLIVVLARTNRQVPHRSLVRPAVVGAFVVWLLVGVAVCMVLAITLSSAEVAYGRTYAGLAVTAFMALTGPAVAFAITRRMAAKIEQG